MPSEEDHDMIDQSAGIKHDYGYEFGCGKIINKYHWKVSKRKVFIMDSSVYQLSETIYCDLFWK